LISYAEIASGLKRAGIQSGRPVLAHASLSAFGQVHGGANALLGALLICSDALMMPAFTYTTMVLPEVGPENNAVEYGSSPDSNRMAEFFRADMPADRVMSVVAETLRTRQGSQRSTHPILSFTGVNVEAALKAQTIESPLEPIQVLEEQDGWVMLVGVNHTRNTAIHYAERLVGRKQFVRWALTARGVCECPAFPGCSDGFEKAVPHLQHITNHIQIGRTVVRVIRIQPMLEILVRVMRNNPQALLCDRVDCGRCNAVRAA
jgi:aminoglycoside 3-N-acetyltransferase